MIAQRPDAHFRRGIQAIDRGEWLKAEDELRRAIQLDSQEKARKVTITGMRYEAYLPYYFLGLAHYRRGNFEGARAAWQRSKEQGVIAEWRDVAIFRRQWSDVVAKVGPPTKASTVADLATPPPQAPSPNKRLAEAIEALEAVVNACGAPRTPLLMALLEAAQALVEARQVQNVNRPDATALIHATMRLEQAKQGLEAARKPRSSRQRIADLRQLVERMKGLRNHQLETTIVQAEMELARNAPDLELLASLEATFLRHLHPELAEVP